MDWPRYYGKYVIRFWDFINAGDKTSALAVVMDLAGSLLHEISHLCCLDFDPTLDHPGQCAPAYLIENIFRWACLNRFSELQNTTCFLVMLEIENMTTLDELYGWDGSVYLTDGCT